MRFANAETVMRSRTKFILRCERDETLDAAMIPLSATMSILSGV